MKNERSIIHLTLDGDLPAEERVRLLKRIESDPVLSKEYHALAEALGTLGREGRREPPPAFTRSVLARLPRRKAPLRERMMKLFFGGRVLRWNLASAVAVLLIVALAAVLATTRQSDNDTVTVRLNVQAPNARQVAVAGDFNKWDPGVNVMSRENGAWTIELPLRPGVYAYMFIVDNEQWITDPQAETHRDDGFGNRNAVMRVRI